MKYFERKSFVECGFVFTSHLNKKTCDFTYMNRYRDIQYMILRKGPHDYHAIHYFHIAQPQVRRSDSPCCSKCPRILWCWSKFFRSVGSETECTQSSNTAHSAPSQETVCGTNMKTHKRRTCLLPEYSTDTDIAQIWTYRYMSIYMD